MALLEIRNITRRFGTLEAVKDVTLAIEAGVGVTTPPPQIYSMIKVAVTPEVNAVSTLLMALTLTLIFAASRLAPDVLKA